MPRILLIDDTPEIAELLSFALRDRGYEVVASGPIRQHTYRFTSLFLPDGAAAWRVTAGVEARQYPRVASTIARMLESFTLGRAQGSPTDNT